MFFKYIIIIDEIQIYSFKFSEDNLILLLTFIFFMLKCCKFKKEVKITIHIFFIILIIQTFLLIYIVYSYIELKFYHNTQGSKLEISNWKEKG